MRIKRIFLASLLMLLAVMAMPSWAQSNKLEVSKVDFDEICRETTNPNSKYYYDKLVASFNSNNTNMNFEPYRYLYYGYVFQPGYNPAIENSFADKDEVEELYYKQELTRDDCNKIEDYAVRALDNNMFDIDQITYYIYALKQKKKFARAQVRLCRLEMLIAAIMSSGRGTENDPWVVIFPDHEYILINFLGYVAEQEPESLHNGRLDCITAHEENNTRNTKKFYFDVSKMYEVYRQKNPSNF